MREDFWHFEPSHTFLMLTNHKPIVSGTDEGIWRRLRLVPWDVVIPAEERDVHLGDQLALELDAMLAWLVTGYQEWREHGLGDPEEVIEATASYRAESDALGRFIEPAVPDRPALHRPGRRTCSRPGRNGARLRVKSTARRPRLARALQGRGLDKFKDGFGRMQWKGIGLAGEDEGSGP